jgi:predicted glycoside hydrolase/deacetylase ChbG (UPF0249 family)
MPPPPAVNLGGGDGASGFVDNIVRKSAYCWPRLAELDVLTSASLKYAIAERGYRLGTFRDL